MKNAVKILSQSPLYWSMTLHQRLQLIKWFVETYGEVEV